MNREDFFACLEKAGEAFEKRVQDAAAEQPLPEDTLPEEDFDLQMQEEELAAQVAREMGLL